MPFNRPTLSSLRQSARAAFAARLQGVDPTLRRSNVTVTADVLAAMTHLQYGYLEWMVEAVLMPDSAEAAYLERWASIWGLSRLGATTAAGNVTFSGTNGTPIPSGSLVQRSDGVQFATQAPASIASGTATVAVEAVIGAAAGNTDAGAALALSTAIAGVQPNAVVAVGGLTGGADVESDDNFRARLLVRIRQPPQGGDAEDYVAWALEVPGVTRAWAYPLHRGIGTVDVAFVMDGRLNIIPLSGDVAAVQAYIDARRPVTADFLAFAPVATALNLTIQGLQPDTADTRAAIATAFAALLQRVAEPGGMVAFSDIDEAISESTGVEYHYVTSPTTDQTATAGHIFIPGTITYV